MRSPSPVTDASTILLPEPSNRTLFLRFAGEAISPQLQLLASRSSFGPSRVGCFYVPWVALAHPVTAQSTIAAGPGSGRPARYAAEAAELAPMPKFLPTSFRKKAYEGLAQGHALAIGVNLHARRHRFRKLGYAEADQFLVAPFKRLQHRAWTPQGPSGQFWKDETVG